MKKTLLFGAVACLATLTAQNLLAQERVLPKNEFTITTFGGLSTLKYSIDDATRKNGMGCGAGVGYNIYFNDHWGLSTGLEINVFRASVKASHLVNGSFWSQTDKGPNGTYDETYLMLFDAYHFKESQKMWQLQVPVMLRWITPMNANKTNHFYIELGAKVGVPVKGKYYQSTGDLSYLDVNMTAADQTPIEVERGLANSERWGSMKFRKINLMGSAEIGFRWKIWGSNRLYTGIYFDYGLLNIAPKESNKPLYIADLSRENHPSEFQGYYNGNSILAASTAKHIPSGLTRAVTYQTDRSMKSYADKVNTINAGIRLSLAFGKCKKAPVPIPVPVVRTEYVHDTVYVEKRDTIIKEVVKEVPVEVKRAMMNLSNTLFAFDKSTLSSDAEKELDVVTNWLKDNPDLNVEVAAYTDSMGSDEYNQKLSENRAKTVYDYFIGHGVDASRLSYKGYGKSQPIADNSTAEGRQKNRRADLKILNK